MVATTPTATDPTVGDDVKGFYAHFIGGRRVQPDGAPDLVRTNPAASNQVLGGFKSADLELVNTAVRTAAAAWGKWRNTAAPTRGKVLLEAARQMDAHREELARLISLEEGKALKDSRAEVQRSINITEFMSGEGRRFGGYTSGSESTTKFAFTTRQPLGVVACITPWNFPLAIPAWKIAPALIAGNAVILKPASATPATAFRLAELYQAAGLPDGILNVLAARGGSAAEALLDADEVRAVSITGSTSTGRHVAARCAARGVPVQGELGGKNAAIVLADADLDLASAGIADGAFGSTGQRCTATSRTIVIDSVADALLEKITARAKKMVVGPGDQPGVQVGPLIRAEHRDRVASYVEKGTAEGAQLVVDGRGEMSRQGFFLGPTILDRVTPQMAVGREEIFGPVLSVARAATLEDAIAQANASSLGNMATIFTQSGRAGREFRERVEAGMTGINVPIAQPFAFFPFSGWKGSFFGDLHVHGTDGIEFYTRKKVVVTRW